MSSLAKSYLLEKIEPFVGPAAREGVVEYLVSCDVGTQQTEMISFLEQFGGKNPKFASIIKQYALMKKNLSRADGEIIAPSSNMGKSKKKTKHKKSDSNCNADSKRVYDNNCGCMASKHDLWGSCMKCGRLYCTEEQVLRCKYCNDLVRPCMSTDDAIAAGMSKTAIEAYKHKVISCVSDIVAYEI